MSKPNFNVRTFDGPRKSGPDLPSPPPSGGSTRRSFAQQPENTGTYPESDDEGSQDSPNQPWRWNSRSRDAPRPTSMYTATPPVANSLFIARRILNGYHHSATFEGIGWHAGGGSSACGLASVNAIRLAFDRYEKLSNNEELVSKLVSEDFVKDAMAIAASWPDDMYLEVEPILELPLFSAALQVHGVRYEDAQFGAFSDVLIALKSDDGPSGPRAALLARPPEMIAVMHIPFTRAQSAAMPRPRVQSIYLVFDPHPRPDHPNGAAVQVFPSRSVDNVAGYLADLFLQGDEALEDDRNLGWNAQPTGQVEYYLLAPTTNRETLNEYELNIRFLSLNRVVSEAQRELETERAEKRELRAKCNDLERELGLLAYSEAAEGDEFGQPRMQRNFPTHRSSDFTTWGQGSHSTNSDFKGKGRSYAQGRPTGSRPGGGGGNGASQFEFPPWNKASDRSQMLRDTPRFSQSRAQPGYSRRPSTAGPSTSKHGNSNVDDIDNMLSLQLAMAMQNEFDEERRRVSLDESLARAAAAERPNFDCGICMESYTDEAISLVDGCNHACCRDCMRSSIQSMIEQRRYPILCPICVAETNGPGRSASTIPTWVVETIGVSDELFDIFTEMQLAEHSILVNCRRCSQSAFIDRRDYDTVETITCPIPTCAHKWCKQCSQTIEGEAKHTCDGSAEFETLFTASGWKRCPGCNTPIEKTMGCNTMRCTSAGCGTTFCYACGGVRGTQPTTRAADATRRCSCGA